MNGIRTHKIQVLNTRERKHDHQQVNTDIFVLKYSFYTYCPRGEL